CSRLRLLFCYYHLIRRQLRSFPTRRSSDLTCHCSPSSSSHASSTPGRLRGERRPDGRSSRAGLPSRSCASAAGPPTVAGTLGSTGGTPTVGAATPGADACRGTDAARTSASAGPATLATRPAATL